MDHVAGALGALEALSNADIRSKRALEVALDTMPVAVSWARLSDQSIVFVNRTFRTMFGYEATDFSGIDDWIDKAYPLQKDRELARAKWGEYFNRPDRLEYPVEPIEVRIQCRDQSLKTAIVSGIILPDTGWALATFVDITERKRNEDLLKEAQSRVLKNQAIYHLLLDHSPEMIVLSPFDASHRYVSPAVAQITGFSGEEYLSIASLDHMHADDREGAQRVIEQLRHGDLEQIFRYRALQKGGGYRWVEARVVGYLDPSRNKVAGYVATIRDIAEQVDHEHLQALEHRTLAEAASLDELTKIANRRTFNFAFEREALTQPLSTQDLSLLLLDVDHFKKYNDFYGHLAGDLCLQQIALALAGALHRKTDLIARFGGEEFVALLPATSLEGAQQIASNLLLAISSLAIPHQLNHGGTVTISIGVACWPAGGKLDQTTLLSQADRALYEAKSSGRNNFQVAHQKTKP